MRDAHKLVVAGGPVYSGLRRDVTVPIRLPRPELPAAASRLVPTPTNPGWCGPEKSDTFQPTSSTALSFAVWVLGRIAAKKDFLGKVNFRPVPEGEGRAAQLDFKRSLKRATQFVLAEDFKASSIVQSQQPPCRCC